MAFVRVHSSDQDFSSSVQCVVEQHWLTVTLISQGRSVFEMRPWGILTKCLLLVSTLRPGEREIAQFLAFRAMGVRCVLDCPRGIPEHPGEATWVVFLYF
jgi:hypothetical protein